MKWTVVFFGPDSFSVGAADTWKELMPVFHAAGPYHREFQQRMPGFRPTYVDLDTLRASADGWGFRPIGE